VRSWINVRVTRVRALLRPAIFIHISIETVLELKRKGSPTAFITVKLRTTDIYQSAAVALADSHKNIKRGNIIGTASIADSRPIFAADALVTTLGSVTLKLDALVKIIDKTSQVFSFLSPLHL
jgi:hypothetical protein